MYSLLDMKESENSFAPDEPTEMPEGEDAEEISYEPDGPPDMGGGE